MEQQIGSFNMVLAQTGSAGRDVAGDTILPGAAMAAQFVSGDGTVAAIGTVTALEGKKVLGFGHGLSLGGQVQIPLSTAYVHTVLASISGSVKLASPLRMVGTITNEGVSGVVGEIGSIPRLIPVDVSVGTGREDPRVFHFDIMKSKLLTSALVGWAAANAALTVSSSMGEMTIEAESDIQLSDEIGLLHDVRYRDVFFTTDPAGAISKIASAPVDVLMDNQFEEVDIKHVSFTLNVKEEPRVATVEEISVRPEEVAPGDSVSITVRLKPYRGEEFSRLLRLKIPATCEAERVGILVCSAPQMRSWEEQSTNRRLPATNLEQLMTQIDSSGRGNRLECVITEQEVESGIDGRAFPSPPGSFSNVLNDAGRSGALVQTRFGILDSAKLETDYAVIGCRAVGLDIKHQRVWR